MKPEAINKPGSQASSGAHGSAKSLDEIKTMLRQAMSQGWFLHYDISIPGSPHRLSYTVIDARDHDGVIELRTLMTWRRLHPSGRFEIRGPGSPNGEVSHRSGPVAT